MRVWAIADLHLPGGDKKPMDVFGEHWRNHFERICADWAEKVSPEDVVLIPGDISWAIDLAHAAPDLQSVGQNPGRIVLLKGNHDFWWNSLTQVKAVLPPDMYLIQNDALCFEEVVVAGTRGWTIPGETGTDEKTVKIYKRELQRLEFSLKAAQKLAEGRPIIAMMHYPPLTRETLRSGTGFTELLTRYEVQYCVYGHLHGAVIANAFCGMYEGVTYDLVSCDALQFALKEIPFHSAGAFGADAAL